MNQEALGIILVLGLFSIIFITAELWRYVAAPPAEWTRKYVHVACGIVIACLHWILPSLWAGLILFFLIALIMLISRVFQLFPSVYAVSRPTLGDVYYLLAASTLFILSSFSPILYFISMLVLTISDSLAAVVGGAYKRNVYFIEKHVKSFEGSTVFFFSTFLIVHIPLLLMLKIDPFQSVMIALQVALVATCLEGVCIHGFDNFAIPIFSFVYLFKLLDIPSEQIAWMMILQGGIFAVLYAVTFCTPAISISSATVGHLFLYSTFLFGGLSWLIVSLIAFTLFATALTFLASAKEESRIYQVTAAFHVTLIPTLLYFANAWLKSDDLYVLFIGAVTANLSIGLYRLLWLNRKEIKSNFVTLAALAAGSYVLMIPLGLWLEFSAIDRLPLAVCGITVIISTLSFYLSFNYFPIFRTFPWEYRIQSLSVLIGILASFTIPKT